MKTRIKSVVKKVFPFVRFVLMALFFFGLGLFAMYKMLIDKTAVQGNLTKNVVNECVAALESMNDINTACVASHNAAAKCLSSVASCNVRNTVDEMKKHNEERSKAELNLAQHVNNIGKMLQNAASALK